MQVQSPAADAGQPGHSGAYGRRFHHLGRGAAIPAGANLPQAAAQRRAPTAQRIPAQWPPPSLFGWPGAVPDCGGRFPTPSPPTGHGGARRGSLPAPPASPRPAAASRAWRRCCPPAAGTPPPAAAADSTAKCRPGAARPAPAGPPKAGRPAPETTPAGPGFRPLRRPDLR